MKFSALSISILFATVLATVFAFGCSGAKPKQSEAPATVVAPSAPNSAVTPEYDGYCAMGVCTGKFTTKGNPDIKLDVDGKTYFFATEADKEKFQKKLASNVKKADRRWRAFINHGGAHAL